MSLFAFDSTYLDAVRSGRFRPRAYWNGCHRGWDLLDPVCVGIRSFVDYKDVMSIPIPRAKEVVEHFLRLGERLDPLIVCALEVREYAAVAVKYAPERKEGCGISVIYAYSIKELFGI